MLVRKCTCLTKIILLVCVPHVAHQQHAFIVSICSFIISPRCWRLCTPRSCLRVQRCVSWSALPFISLSSSWQAPPGKRLEIEFSLFSTLGCSQRGVQRIEDASFVSRRASKQMLTWNAKRCIYTQCYFDFFLPPLVYLFCFSFGLCRFICSLLTLSLSPSLPPSLPCSVGFHAASSVCHVSSFLVAYSSVHRYNLSQPLHAAPSQYQYQYLNG